MIEKYNVKVKTYSFDIRDFNEAVKMANDLQASEIVPDILINNAGLASGKDKIYEGLIKRLGKNDRYEYQRAAICDPRYPADDGRAK